MTNDTGVPGLVHNDKESSVECVASSEWGNSGEGGLNWKGENWVGGKEVVKKPPEGNYQNCFLNNSGFFITFMALLFHEIQLLFRSCYRFQYMCFTPLVAANEPWGHAKSPHILRRVA